MTEENTSTTAENSQPTQATEVQPTEQSSPQEQFTAIKEKLATGEATPADQKQFRQLRDHLYFDGPLPDHMRTQSQQDGNAPHDTLGTSELYERAQDPRDFKTPVNVPEGLAPGDVDGMKQLAYDLSLPKHIGDAFIERVVRHIGVNEQENGISQIDQLDDAGLEVYLEELLRCFGGDRDKATVAATKAENYFRQTLPQDQFNRLMDDIGYSTLVFDPFILTKLAALHDARGFKL